MLIDAGITCKQLELSLQQIQVTPKEINAILLTHEHSDHTKGAVLFSSKYCIPIYATAQTFVGIETSSFTKIENGITVTPHQVITIRDIQFYPYTIPHDANDPVGYTVFDGKSKIAIATDLGYIPNGLNKILKNSDLILLESNHDIEMLQRGRYPSFLKKRILGNFGHLSNTAAGEFLSTLISPKLKHVFLGHLSQENNTAALAYQTVSDILNRNLRKNQNSFSLSISPARKIGPLIELD